jgi:leader peptidase (prepilin peptidase)/N-methyltransferase
MVITNALVILFGLLIGSFLNVVIYRLPAGESVVRPGSRCVACGHHLGARDLVPVLSWLWLKGRCRHCGDKISIRYPAIELLTALAFLLVYLQWGISFMTLSGWILTFILITCAAIDYDQGLIPNRITYPGLILALFLSGFTVGVPSAFLGALLYGGILLLTAILSSGGMGGGDIKLAAVIGAFGGLPASVLAFILTSLLGGVWAGYLVISRKGGRKSEVKFGPFLAMGGWPALVYGPDLISAYWFWIVHF